MKYVYTKHQGDKEIIEEAFQRFSQWEPSELVDYYNRQLKIGIVGVRQQMLTLIALDKVFHEKFYDSPIVKEDRILSLSSKLALIDKQLVCAKHEN
jgi:hypothetical protein